MPKFKHLAITAVTALLLNGCVTVTDGEAEIAKDPKQMAESRISLGLGYLESGNMLKARENLEMAVKHAPDYYRAQLSLAHYYERVDEPDRAEKLYKKALRSSPRNGNVLNNYGTFLCKKGEYKQADKYFNRAIDQPYYFLLSASYENAGFCALKAGNTEQASNYFKRSLDHDPNRVRAMLQLAQIEINNQEYKEARIRLMKFHQQYGYKVPSLKLLTRLEGEAGNKALQQRYQNKLDEMLANSA